MTGAKVLRDLFDDKKIRVLQCFVQQQTDALTLNEVVEQSKVPLATTYRILNQLVEIGLLRRFKQKHLKVYSLAQTQDAQFMAKLLYEKPAPVSKFVDYMASITGIEQVIMHGKEEENRANIVITGANIDRDAINARVAEIRDNDRFTINHLILEPEQFNMLESMGQFSGSKTVLFPR